MKILIRGCGLAGAWMARTLLQRGVDVQVYDPDTAGNSSRVAAGLINPTTGSRPKSTWRSELLLPFAREAYAQAETEWDVQLWTPRTIRRIFLTEKDQTLWYNAVERGVGVEWSPLDQHASTSVLLPYGGVEYPGATVDTNGFIDGMVHVLREEGRYLESDPNNEHYRLVIWCQGWTAARHELWSWLPFQPVKGEILDAEISGLALDAVHIRGIWIIPQAEVSDVQDEEATQRIRIGSTHDWDDLSDKPTPEAKATLVEKASTLLNREIVVRGQRAAVRPAARSKRPYIGVHPQHPSHAIVNGLGAKGSLWAPWAAVQLADHLLDGKPLDEEVNIQRWWTT